MDLRCETCRYWDKSYEECHLGPPTIHPDNLIGIWPGTVASDWCGEHEARMELPIVEKEVSTHTPVSLEDVKEYHRRRAAADALASGIWTAGGYPTTADSATEDL